MIAAHLDALAARLPRHGHWTRALLAEAADGLADAAAAYREAGLPAGEAERRAVADFGAVDVVAPAYRQEIALRQARRTSRILCAALPPVLLAWSAVPAAGSAPHGWTVLAVHLAGLAVLTVVLAAAALACTGRLGVPPARVRRRLPGLVGDAAVVGGVALAAGTAALLATLPLADPGLVALAAGTALATGGVAWSGALCRRAARTP